VFLRRLRENDDFDEVHQATFLLESPKTHVDGPLEGLRGVRKTERKANVAMGSVMIYKDRLVAVFMDLPILRVAVEQRKHLSVPEKVNRIVHTWQWLDVPCRYLVVLAEIHAKPYRPVELREQDHREGLLYTRGLDEPEVP